MRNDQATQTVNCLLLTAVFTAVPAMAFAVCPVTTNAVTFLGIDTTTQGAWKGAGNFNAPPASSSLTYGKDGDILPDTEGCDLACNPVPNDASFGPQCINSATPGNTGFKPNSTHAYVNLMQGPANVIGAEPQNATNTNYFECNYTDNNPAVPWAPMVAWRPVVDTREISKWYTCGGISSFYLELSFGNSTHNFEVYVVDDMNGGTLARTEELKVLDGDTGALLWDSGVFTNFSGGVYYKWAITGHVKIQVINHATNGRDAVINGVFFDPPNAAPTPPALACPTTTAAGGVLYNSALMASGGQPPYTFSILSGSLPPGLMLTPSSGAITGAPGAGGSFSFTAKVVDFSNQTAGTTTANCTITTSPQQVAAPTLSLPGGSYSATQQVSLSTTTAGASISYTTDGVTTPTETVGVLYVAGSPITVSSTTTIKAIAYAAGMTDSSVSTATYTINAGGGGAWTNRRKITIDHTKVSGGGNLSSFPMLVSLMDPELKSVLNGGKVGKSDGTDLLFTAGDGATKLNHELESYGATTGNINAWVQIPNLSATADTVIYLYYGNASAADQQNKTGVWDPNYKGVWHLSEASGNFNDSTAGANTGAATSVLRTTGEAAGGGSFDGSSSYVSVANQSNFMMTTAVTEELWLKKSGSGGFGYIFHKYYDGNSPAYWISSNGDQLRAGIRYSPGNYSQVSYTNASWHDGNWHHVAMVFSGSTLNLYFDGALATSSATGGPSIADSGGTLTIGRFDGPNGLYFGGAIDEPRVSNSARPAGWIATEFSNLNSPSTFYGLGLSETVP